MAIPAPQMQALHIALSAAFPAYAAHDRLVPLHLGTTSSVARWYRGAHGR